MIWLCNGFMAIANAFDQERSKATLRLWEFREPLNMESA